MWQIWEKKVWNLKNKITLRLIFFSVLMNLSIIIQNDYLNYSLKCINYFFCAWYIFDNIYVLYIIQKQNTIFPENFKILNE